MPLGVETVGEAASSAGGLPSSAVKYLPSNRADYLAEAYPALAARISGADREDKVPIIASLLLPELAGEGLVASVLRGAAPNIAIEQALAASGATGRDETVWLASQLNEALTFREASRELAHDVLLGLYEDVYTLGELQEFTDEEIVEILRNYTGPGNMTWSSEHAHSMSKTLDLSIKLHQEIHSRYWGGS
jgi:hypothetical protein